LQGGEGQGGVSRLTPTSESVSGTNVTEPDADADGWEAPAALHTSPVDRDDRNPAGKGSKPEREPGSVAPVPGPERAGKRNPEAPGRRQDGAPGPVRPDRKAPTPKDAAPPSHDEQVLLECADILATFYCDLFPTHEVDPAHFAALMRRGHDCFEIESVIKDFLPVTNFPGIESSADFMLAYKELARQHGAYRDRALETCTDSHMEAWIETRRASMLHEGKFARLERCFNTDRPIDPDDAAEEQAWQAADQAIDDGDAAELDPMHDPFAGEREDAEYGDGMHDPFIELPLAPPPAAGIPLWKVLAGDGIPCEVWEDLAEENPKVPPSVLERYQWGVFLGDDKWKFFRSEKAASDFVLDNSPAAAGQAG
jgi:hypothetical protein